MSDLEAGEFVKILLPGESPWATVVSVHDDGRMAVRIDNHLVSHDLHGYDYGDVVTVEIEVTPGGALWKLAPLDKQLPVVPTEVA